MRFAAGQFRNRMMVPLPQKPLMTWDNLILMTTHANRAGNYVRDARKSASLTQAELAERSGVATRTISQLESGRATNVKTSTISKLSRALQLDEDSLFRAFTADVAGSGSVDQPMTDVGTTTGAGLSTVPIPTAPLTIPSAPLTSVFAATAKLDEKQKSGIAELVDAVGSLFTAYALALIDDASADGERLPAVPGHLVALLRMQSRMFPDTSQDRVYLDWLTGLGPTLTSDQLTIFEERWNSATTRLGRQ